MIEGRYAALAGAMGLSVSDLAEIGGFSDRFARDLLAGRRPFPEPVKDALELLDFDVNVLVDAIMSAVEEGAGVIFIFRTNEEVRTYFPDWPGRGHAAGGFIGPHRTAALAASDHLAENGIDVDLYFYDAPPEEGAQ